jgi:arsenite methyltransferase
MPAALAEARRVLVPNGRFLVLDTEWDSVVWRSSDESRMGRVLRAWEEHVVHRDLPRRLPQLLAEAGFALTSCTVVPIINVGYDRDAFSTGMLEVIASFVAGRQGVTAEEASAWAADLRAMGPNYFFSLNRYLFLARNSRTTSR